MVFFLIKHTVYRKSENIFNIVPFLVPANPFASICVFILYTIYVSGMLGPVGGGWGEGCAGRYPTANRVTSGLVGTLFMSKYWMFYKKTFFNTKVLMKTIINFLLIASMSLLQQL